MNQLKLFQIDNLQARPPLRYPGSKYGALKIIQKYLPKTNISDYCEPFFGSGAFYFKLIESDAKIILNDYDKNLINFYQIIKDKKNIDKFCKIVSKFKPSKKNFDKIKTKLFSNNFDKAVQYFIINRTAYSGIMNKPNWGYHPERSVQPHKWSERIKQANAKLINSKLYSKDFRIFFSKFKLSKKTFLFIDPPYYSADQKRAYFKSFTKNDHADLCQILKNTKNKFLLTYDNVDEVKKLYNWANLYPTSWRYHTANSNKATRKKGNEIIITNY